MQRFSNILFVVDLNTDLSADRSAALQSAITLVKNNQARLTICACIDEIPPGMQMAITAVTPQELFEISFNEAQVQLDQVVEKLAEPEQRIDTKVLVGKPFIEIIRQVLKNGYDMVVKSADSAEDIRDMLFGSTDMHLMRKCPCPVWIINRLDKPKYRRILAAVDQDFNEETRNVLNQQILEVSTSLAVAEFSELHIVHAWNLLGESIYRGARGRITDAEVDRMIAEEAQERTAWLEKLVETYGVKADHQAVDLLKPELHVVKGEAKNVVPAIACELDVDLVVMGTVARTGVAGFFMGNTAESILNQINCSVLAVKPPGFVTPVRL